MQNKLRTLLIVIPRILRSPPPTHPLIEDIAMASTKELTDIKIKIADNNLAAHKELALKVSSIIGSRVYVFDPACFFSTPPYDTVLYDNIRTVRKENKTALLSTSIQASVPSSDLYRRLIDPRYVSSDSYGVFVKS